MKRTIASLILLTILLFSIALAEPAVPKVKFYIQHYIAHIDREAVVSVQCLNPRKVAGGQSFQLRNQDGRVLGELKWFFPHNRIAFHFTPDKTMLGGHELSVWWNDTCVSTDVGYMAVSDLSSPAVCQLKPARPAVALTIVCGGGTTKNMDDVLAVLDKHQVKATFFINGHYLNLHPEDAKRIVPAGHELGSHGFRHVDMTKMDNYRQMRNIITIMNDHCEQLLGVRPRLFRAPYSYTNAKVTALARAEGMEDVKWSIDSQDWSDAYKYNPRGILGRVTGKNCVSGSIIQFHLNGFHTPQVLDECIPLWRKMGFDVVTVSELLALSGREIPALPPRRLDP